MEPEEKRKVKEDLERFARRKAYYSRVRKAWKRGYLLHGPPGTGKSSLIAAMANFLRFDFYDLELTEVRSNSTFRKLLVRTANRSIIVVEDIDCTIELQDRKDAKTDSESLVGSGNHDDKERLDPALLRSGRMDMHIHMSYCSPSGFKTLLSNYHNVDDHPLCPEVDLLLREVEGTPAEVAEELLKSDDT
ncbi:hypothetical protein HPP92_011292 [Vanilla planifolia]|uniref:AAA+ ATPase domain-containing protein n=1 Tax=Vanilla planifolia TaxID=51239 RepID=A0A835R3Y6_VANPL|nr:hypothetical protein HPP92_011292 [Vanilla planifolia]